MLGRSPGFTLIELLMVIILIAVSMTLAVPSFQGMVARNTVAAEVNNMLLAINLARSEAMRRGSPVTVQAIDDSEAIDEFGEGYCVQVGIPGAVGYSNSCSYVAGKCASGTPPKQVTGCVLRQFGPLPGSATLNSIQNVSSLTFGSLGELSSTTIQNLDMCIGGEEGRRIQITLVGRSRSHRPGDTIEPDCP